MSEESLTVKMKFLNDINQKATLKYTNECQSQNIISSDNS
jgi:hypothetical protein